MMEQSAEMVERSTVIRNFKAYLSTIQCAIMMLQILSIKCLLTDIEVVLSQRNASKPGRFLMNMQLTTYNNTFLLTRKQILQRRTIRNTQLPIKIYDS